MAAINETQTKGNNTYYNIVNGKISTPCEETTEGVKTRTNSEGTIKHELHYSGLVGQITNVSFKAGKYGRQLEVKLTDGGANDVLNIECNSGYGSSFLNKIANVDLTKPVKIEVFAIKEGDKTKQLLTIKQAGESGLIDSKIATAYTKENPNGLPQWEQIFLKDGVTPVLKNAKNTYDTTAQENFYTNLIEAIVQPKLVALYHERNAAKPAVNTPDGLPTEFGADSDTKATKKAKV